MVVFAVFYATGDAVAGKPAGMEADDSWSLDSTRSGFEKMESGVNARARDFGRFGMLLAREGSWEGSQHRGGGPLIARFKDPADNILSVIQQD